MIERYINIVFDSSKAEQGAKRFDRSLKNVGKSADRLNALNGKAEGGAKRFDRSLHGASKSADRLSTSLKDAAKPLNSMVSGVNSLRASMNPLAAAIAGVVAGRALGGAVQKVITAQREFDRLNAGLITATGSADKASIAFDRLQGFAAKTPYSLKEVVSGFTKLKNLGLDPSEDAMMSYGNTAAAMGKSLDQMIEAVADAATGEFERLKEFGIRASSEGERVTFTFRNVATNIGKNAKEIEDYLKALGDNEFAGASTARVETLDGAISNLTNSWDNLLLAVSQSGIGDAMESAVRGMTKLIDGFAGDVDDVIGVLEVLGVLLGSRLVFAFGAYTASMLRTSKANVTAVPGFVGVNTALGVQAAKATRTTVALNALALASRGAGTAFKALNIALGGIPGVITMAAAGFAYYILQADEASTANDVLSQSIENLTVAQAKDQHLKTEKSLEAEKNRVIELSREVDRMTQRWLEFAKGPNKNPKAQEELGAKIKETGIELALAEEKAENLESRLSSLADTIAGKKPAVLGANTAVKSEGSGNVKVASELGGVRDETRLMKGEYDLRSELYAEYGQKIYDQSLSDHERQLAALDYRLKEERSREKTKHIRDLARLKQKKQDLLAQEDVSADQKAAITKAFDDREAVLKQAHELRLTEITAQGENARSELKGDEEKRLSDLMASLQLETAAMRQAYDLRSELYTEYGQKVYDQSLSDHERQLAALDYRLQEEMNAENVRYANSLARLAENREAILSEQALTDEQKIAARDAFNEQEKILEQEHQSALTEISKQGADERKELTRHEFNAIIDAKASFASASVQLAASFGKKSAKQQRRFAIVESGIAITAGVAKALNNPYPANLGFAAQVAAQGAGLISKLRGGGRTAFSDNASGGSFGGSRGFSSALSSTMPPYNTHSRPAREFPQKVIELRGLDENKLFSAKDVLEILREADVAVVINDSIAEARRIGAINDDDDEW